MNPVASQVILISGAAGGLGQALVAELAGAGHRVLAGWHHASLPPLPDGAEPVALDVTSQASCDAAAGRVLERWGRLDAVIHAAGITRDAVLARQRSDDWDAVFAVNLDGARRLGRATLPHLAAQGGGHWIGIGSHAGIAGSAGQAAYAASKAALEGLLRSWAREFAPNDVRVNTVLPGVLPTAMTAALDPAMMRSYAEANLLGRINDPAEVARFVAFLLTTANISGQSFALDSRIHRWA
ncbi:MAG: SDR family NAD(P)-dependent oxidoreductase [Verrucomicrobiota bacterium]